MHREWDYLLALYVAGKASPAETQRLEQHLRACSICPTNLETWRHIKSVVQAEGKTLRGTIQLPALSLAKLPVRSRLEHDTPAMRPRRRSRLPVSLAVALLVVGMTGILIIAQWSSLSLPLTPEVEEINPPSTVETMPFATSRVPDVNVEEIDPQVRPNAPAQVLFTSLRDGNSEIHLMNVDGTNVRNLTQNLAEDYNAAWSPDGSTIAFISDREGTSDLYTMNIDDGNIKRLTNTPDTSEFSPAWSPNGQSIAFERSDADGIRAIYIVGVDGLGFRKLSSSGSDSWSPTWTPDSQQIIFISQTNDRSTLQVYYAAVDGSSINMFMSSDTPVNRIALSPNGKLLVYTVGTEIESQIFIYDVTLKTITRLLDAPERLTYPSWSPDGRFITFTKETVTVSQGAGGTQQICLIAVDGSGYRCLTSQSVNYASQFQP